MKVRLSLRTGADVLRNVEIEADATATVGHVAATLAEEIGAPREGPVTLAVVHPASGVRRTLSARTTLVDSRVESGVIVELAAAPQHSAHREADAALVRVCSGPDTGIEIRLGLGTATLGRAPECDIRLQDQAVSKRHLKIIVGSRIEVLDTNSANGVFVGGAQVTRSTVLPGQRVAVGETELTITPLQGIAEDASTTDVAFNRSPRILVRPVARAISVPQLPRRQQRESFPWLAMIAPLLMGAMLYAFTRSLLSVVFVALSPLMMLGSWGTQKIEARGRRKEEIAEFDEGLSQVTAQVADWQEEDRERLLELHPSVSSCVEAARSRGPLLWSRRPEHPEFLTLRLGLGEIAALSTVKFTNDQAGLARQTQMALRAAEASMSMDGAPVVADFPEVGCVGVCGPDRLLPGVTSSLVLQAATLHSPAELVMVCLTSPANRLRWAWLEWLPHCSSPHSPVNAPQLSADDGSGRMLLDALEGLVDARLAAAGANATRVRGPLTGETEKARAAVPVPAVLVIVDDTAVDRGRLTRICERGPDAGVYVLWVASARVGLPAACRTFLDLEEGGAPVVGQVRREEHITPLVVESADERTVHAVARLIAPMVDAGSPIDDDSDLPQDVSVISLLGRETSDDSQALIMRWRENRSLVQRGGAAPVALERKSGLRAIVGHAGYEPFAIDLRTQGPHALVGGTTGAGKSEFLQAWVLGLAHAYSPDRVTFLFVDYKGGSAFAHCLELPHTVGLVTDLSPYLVRRALRSLGAELRRRERLLNEKGKKDLIDLEMTGDPDCPPSLIIIVDEFAALVTEVPEFVDGVVDVAQRGRSLGLHLILATQRPAGVIKENLRANTNLRIALRMADEDDSSDVVGTSIAAHFPAARPGRAVAKTGPGRLTPFQSGYPGARTPDQPPVPPIRVADLDFGTGRAWQTRERGLPAADLDTDAVRIVRTVSAAAQAAGVPKPRRPWLPSLSAAYDLARLNQRSDGEVVLGVVDDPDRQEQIREFFYPDKDGNIVYAGAGGSGKSTALRSLALAMSITPRGGPVHVYGLDFGGGGLSLLEPLPNVGSIISGDDDERVERLMRFLTQLADSRQRDYTAVRAPTLADYRRLADNPTEPRVLVLIDGFGQFRSEYEDRRGRQETYDAFQRLIVDGRALGIHFAISADRPLTVPPSVLASFPSRIILRQADESGYESWGVAKDVLTAASPPGRAVEAIKGLELQIAVLGRSIATTAQAREIEQLAADIAPFHQVTPHRVRRLPERLLSTEIAKTLNGHLVVGMADQTLQALVSEPAGIVLVAGPPRSGRSNAMRWLARATEMAQPSMPRYLMSLGKSPLGALPGWHATAADLDAVDHLASELLERRRRDGDSGPRLGVFVDGLPEFADTAAEYNLVELLKLFRRSGDLIVVEGETASLAGSYGLLDAARAGRTAILLQPEPEDGDRLTRTELPFTANRAFPPGRGYWVKGGGAHMIQVPLDD